MLFRSVVDKVLGHVATADSVRVDYTPVIDRVVTLVERWGPTVQDCDWMASTLLRLVQVTKHQQRDKMIETLKLLLTTTNCDEGDAASVLELNSVRQKLARLLQDITVSRESSGRPVPAPVTSLRVWSRAQFYDPDTEDGQEIVSDILARS